MSLNYSLLSDKEITDHIKKVVENTYPLLRKGNINNYMHSFKYNLEIGLDEFDIEQDKFEYCQYLYILLKRGLKEHVNSCKEKKPCQGEKEFEKAIFIVDRKIKAYLSERSYTYEYVPEDPFSLEEEIEILRRLDEISDRLSRIELGQKITYDDFDEQITQLKKLAPILGKKKFFELVKGTLFSWGFDKLIDTETINTFYQILTDSVQKLISQ